MLKLTLLTLRTMVIGLLVLGLCLFLPAGTLAYWQAWLFIATALVSTNAIGLWLWFRNSALLERRKRVGPAAEGRPAQKAIAVCLIVLCVGVLVLCGLDRRFGWSRVPALVSVLGDELVALGLFLTWLVLRVNSYASSTIETAPGQRVISTGPYALVRHPMYAGTIIMLVGIPLALASWWGLLTLAPMLAILAWRILDEERFLEQELAEYLEYERNVRWRLLPYVW